MENNNNNNNNISLKCCRDLWFFFARWVLNIGYLLHKYFINRVVKAIKVMEKYSRIYLRHKMLLKQEKISPLPLNYIEGNFRFRQNTQVKNSVSNSGGKYFSFFIYFFSFFIFNFIYFFFKKNNSLSYFLIRKKI